MGVLVFGKSTEESEMGVFQTADAGCEVVFARRGLGSVQGSAA